MPSHFLGPNLPHVVAALAFQAPERVLPHAQVKTIHESVMIANHSRTSLVNHTKKLKKKNMENHHVSWISWVNHTKTMENHHVSWISWVNHTKKHGKSPCFMDFMGKSTISTVTFWENSRKTPPWIGRSLHIGAPCGDQPPAPRATHLTTGDASNHADD